MLFRSAFKARNSFRKYCTSSNPTYVSKNPNKGMKNEDYISIQSLDQKYRSLTKQIREERKIQESIPWWRRSWFKKRSVGEYEFIRLPSEKESVKMRKLREDQKQMDRIRFLQLTSLRWKFTKFFYNDKAHIEVHGATMWCLTKEHSERIEWRTLELPINFNSWFVISMLHIWMLYVRSRNLENDSYRDNLMQKIVDDYFYDIDRGIVLSAGVTNFLLVGRASKQFFNNYGGALVAYDESYNVDDAHLAEAIYRNIFGADPNIATPTKLAALVEYVRKNLKMLENLDDRDFLVSNWKWEEPPNLSDIFE